MYTYLAPKKRSWSWLDDFIGETGKLPEPDDLVLVSAKNLNADYALKFSTVVELLHLLDNHDRKTFKNQIVRRDFTNGPVLDVFLNGAALALIRIPDIKFEDNKVVLPEPASSAW